ncbi:hypothetical protein [Streptomyces sp. RKAG293]|uniref:hypothetical protein n=1 Tax=Streptomyces sp. RKAG293 TaxID=2893403 RepID=UPI002033A700|nr:hypothetical protein [Streptomyces sp. RKAG293]MCM2416669.1 hypothetical protein [Streptomyces sp. RKAG293]
MTAWLRGGGRPSVGISTTGPKPWLRTDAPGTCPVPEEQRTWTERWLRWCAEEFGPATSRREIALSGFVPADFTGTQEQAERLVRRIGAVMGADVSGIDVLLVESPEKVQGRKHQVGEYRKVLGRAVIELDRRVAARPDAFAGLVAHELAHARLIGEGRIAGLGISRSQEERLTDLVTVHLGMGVLSANAADDYGKVAGYSVMPVGELTDRMLTGRRDEPLHRMGYLSPGEYGYALACWSTMRGESDPSWARHVRASARDVLMRGLAYRAAQRQAGAG